MGKSSSLSDRFINEITSLPVHSITSIDVVPVLKDLTTKTLQKKYLGIEQDIIKQQRVRNKNNDFSTEISYAKRTEKKEIEAIMDDVRENDQCLFYVAVTIIVMAESKKELDSICATIETIAQPYGGTDLYKLYKTNIHEKIAEQKKRDSQSNLADQVYETRLTVCFWRHYNIKRVPFMNCGFGRNHA